MADDDVKIEGNFLEQFAAMGMEMNSTTATAFMNLIDDYMQGLMKYADFIQTCMKMEPVEFEEEVVHNGEVKKVMVNKHILEIIRPRPPKMSGKAQFEIQANQHKEAKANVGSETNASVSGNYVFAKFGADTKLTISSETTAGSAVSPKVQMEVTMEPDDVPDFLFELSANHKEVRQNSIRQQIEGTEDEPDA